MEKTNYNDIYKKLVEESNDDEKIIGIVAYAIYKQAKIEWIQKFKDEKGRSPTEEDFNNFYKSISTEVNLNGFKTQAYDLLDEYLLIMEEKIQEETQKEIEQIEKNIKKEYQEKFERQVKYLLNPSTKEVYLHSIIQNIIGSILTIILIGVMYFVIITYKNTNPITDITNEVDKNIQNIYKKNFISKNK